MLSEPLLVEHVACDQRSMRVRGQRKSTCGVCSARAACGHGIVQGLGMDERERFTLALTDRQVRAFKAGETVHVLIPEKALLALAFQAYVLPLLGLLATVTLVAYWLPSQTLLHAIAALGGLGGGLWWSVMRPRMRSAVVQTLMQSEVVPATKCAGDSAY